MTRSSVTSQRFVRNLRNVRPAHYDGHAGGANRIGNAVSLLSHSGHGADPDKLDVLRTHKLNNLIIAHRPRVGINQNYFMTRRGYGLQQKHPEVRHKVARHPVVGIVEQDFHVTFSVGPVGLMKPFQLARDYATGWQKEEPENSIQMTSRLSLSTIPHVCASAHSRILCGSGFRERGRIPS